MEQDRADRMISSSKGNSASVGRRFQQVNVVNGARRDEKVESATACPIDHFYGDTFDNSGDPNTKSESIHDAKHNSMDHSGFYASSTDFGARYAAIYDELCSKGPSAGTLQRRHLSRWMAAPSPIRHRAGDDRRKPTVPNMSTGARVSKFPSHTPLHKPRPPAQQRKVGQTEPPYAQYRHRVNMQTHTVPASDSTSHVPLQSLSALGIHSVATARLDAIGASEEDMMERLRYYLAFGELASPEGSATLRSVLASAREEVTDKSGQPHKQGMEKHAQPCGTRQSIMTTDLAPHSDQVYQRVWQAIHAHCSVDAVSPPFGVDATQHPPLALRTALSADMLCKVGQRLAARAGVQELWTLISRTLLQATYVDYDEDLFSGRQCIAGRANGVSNHEFIREVWPQL